MAKQTFKTKCDSISQGNNQSAVRFLVELPSMPPVKSGDPVIRLAKVIIQISFNDPLEAAKYKHGKNYVVTIENI
jgi:hypothetical protein